MNRPVIGLVGRQPIVSVSGSMCVCVAHQCGYDYRAKGGVGVCSSDSHCIGLTAVPFIKDHSLKVKARSVFHFVN